MKTKHIILIIGLILTSILITYGVVRYYEYKETKLLTLEVEQKLITQEEANKEILVYKTNTKENFKFYGVIVGSGIMIIIFAFYVISKVLEKENKANLPKEVVNLDDFKEIFKKKWVLITKVPHFVKYNNKMKDTEIITENKNDLQFLDNSPYVSKETGQTYTTFNFLSLKGTKAGISYVQIPLDRGLEWIKHNIDWFVRESTLKELVNIKTEPSFEAIEEKNERINLAKLTIMNESGLNLSELKQFDEFKTKQRPKEETNEEELLEIEKRNLENDKRKIDNLARWEKIKQLRQ